MNNNCESFDTQLPITFWLSRAFGLIFFSDNSHGNGYFISAYIISVLFISFVTYCRISVFLFADSFEYDVANYVLSTSNTAFLIIAGSNFYGKLINMYCYRKELKLILTEISSLEKRNCMSNIKLRYFRGFLLTILTMLQVYLYFRHNHNTFALFFAFNVDVMKIPLEYFFMFHILSKIHEEFRNINNSLQSMDISNSKIVMQSVTKWINYHTKMSNLANKLNHIFMFNNLSTLFFGLICIIVCGHYNSYPLRFFHIFAEGSPCLVANVLLLMTITFMLQEWISIQNEVRLYTEKTKNIYHQLNIYK